MNMHASSTIYIVQGVYLLFSTLKGNQGMLTKEEVFCFVF